MAKSLLEMAADIVQSQSSSTSMTTEEVTFALQNTYRILQTLQLDEAKITGMQEALAGGEPTAKKANLTPEKSIQKNKIICLECGQEFRMLSPKHLRSHELTGRQYREKYGFSLRQPLCAKSLSERRKKAGKDRGLPENLKKAIEMRKKNPKPPATPKKKTARKKAAAKK